MNPLADVHRTTTGRATLGDQLRRHARTQPNKPAVIFHSATGRREVSYAALNALANKFANALLSKGVARGDRVAMMSLNSVEYVAAYYGALKIGAVFTGVNTMFGANEIAYQLNHAEPTVLLAQADFAAAINTIRAELSSVEHFICTSPDTELSGWESWSALVESSPDDEPDVELDENDLALISYTSGTESFPKGVMIPHRNYLISTIPAWSWGLHASVHDRWLFVMPFYTIAGIGTLTILTNMGASLVLPADTNPARTLELIHSERINVIGQTPTFYLGLAALPNFNRDYISSVRKCLSYGGLLSKAAVEAWAEHGAAELKWGTYWGQSELTQLGTVGWFGSYQELPNGDPSWIGKPVSHLEVRVVDSDGRDCAEGELICRTPSVMLGYYKDEVKSSALFEDGWLRTGDLVEIDSDSNLFFRDRVKDVVKSGGMNISTQEVESSIAELPEVTRVAVIGLPDEYWSEAVTAFVVLTPGSQLTEAAVIAHCKSSIAKYKVPKAVHFVSELPTDSQGKLLKRELRRQHQAEPTL